MKVKDIKTDKKITKNTEIPSDNEAKDNVDKKANIENKIEIIDIDDKKIKESVDKEEENEKKSSKEKKTDNDSKNKPSKKKKVVKYIERVLVFVAVTFVILLAGIYSVMWICVNGPCCVAGDLHICLAD